MQKSSSYLFANLGKKWKNPTLCTKIFYIYCPRGTKGFYAEPFSHYTDFNKFNFKTKDLWDGKSVETIGSEAEWIGQRGSKFKVLKIDGNTIYLQMIGQLQ